MNYLTNVPSNIHPGYLIKWLSCECISCSSVLNIFNLDGICSCGVGLVTPFLEYNSTLRMHRREFHRHIGSPAALCRLSSVEEIELRRLLLRILEDPHDLDAHIRRYVSLRVTRKSLVGTPRLWSEDWHLFFRSTGAIILKVAYGYTPALRGKDKLLELSETAVEVFTTIFDGGAWIVDLCPPSEL